MTKNEIPFDKYKILKEKASKIAELLRGLDGNLAIILIPNSDNLCASGILISCLKKVKVGCHAIFISNSVGIEKRTKKLNYQTYIFIGIQAKDLPNNILKDEEKNIIILEHSFNSDKRLKIPWEKIHVLSLKDEALDTNSLSNAGFAYFIAEGFDEEYYKHSGLAIIGGLAKKQINPDNQELMGLNKLILEEGKEKQILKISKGTRIPGRESQPIHLALKYSINPYFPGLTGNESACTSFVSKLGISMRDQDGNWRTISSLTSEETKKLNDGLISLLMGEGSQSISEIHKLIGPIYILTTETQKDQTRNLEEFLWLLEGACQIKKYGLALSVVLGDRSNLYDQLLRDLSDYHGDATKIIEEIVQSPEVTEDKQYYRIIRDQEVFVLDSVPLVIKALVQSGIIPIDVPLLLHTKENDNNHLFVHDSPSQMSKGYRVFQIFQDLIKKEVLTETSFYGDVEFFRLTMKEETVKIALKELEKALIYHHRGFEKEEDN